LRILFISTHNLATNPRLVKEIDLALQNGFEVSLLCCEFNNWSNELNQQIKKRFLSRIKYYPVAGNRKPFLRWAISSISHFLSKKLLKFFPTNILLLSLRSNKRSWLLLKQLKGIKETVNLVVAHNSGSFYAAMRFGQKNEIPFGIDLEDYHPGESNDVTTSTQYKTLQNRLLPEAQYVSAASPLILEYAQRDCEKEFRNKTVVLNYFPANEFIMPALKEDEKLKLVWFSQVISFNRGLEQVVPLIKDNAHLELHLFGNCDEAFKTKYLTGFGNIFIHYPLSQQMLHEQLSSFDVGLAIEPGKDLNNQLAISNKMLAYFQSGLYILASDTKAQKQFLEMHPESGRVTTLDEKGFTSTLNQLVQQKKSIRDKAAGRFERAKDFCWEEESKKLMNSWHEIIH
jgi:hypothetical protein